MADAEAVRQRIISSVFSKRNASGGTTETYVDHVKIWETDGNDGLKPRYILLSKTSGGLGLIHKSKLNTNGTFSVGKTWKLAELRGLEVLDSLHFNITLARTYKWKTEQNADQERFLTSIVTFFREVAGGQAPLQLLGFSVPDNTKVRSSLRNGHAIPAPIPSRAAGRTNGARSQSPFVQGSLPSSPANGGEFPRSVRALSPPSSAGRPDPRRPRTAQGEGSRKYSPSPSRARPTSPPRNRPSSPPSASATPARPPPPTRRPSTGRGGPGTPPPIADGIPAIHIPPVSPLPARTSQDIPQLQHRRGPSNGRPSLDVPSPGDLPPGSAAFSPMSAYDQAESPLKTKLRERIPSPAPSSTSRRSAGSRSQQSRGSSPSRQERQERAEPIAAPQPRRDPNARVSFFDPTNQALLDRLLATDAQEGEGSDVEDESAQVTMSNIEEMLEGYEWAAGDFSASSGGKRTRGAADQIESRLLNELMALEKANIYGFLESDDRIATVLKYLDDAVVELDGLESSISSYKIHLNAVSDDISYIQGQNRGLQVQTQNQRALLNELEQLLQTVHVDRNVLMILTQESLEKSTSIQRLEEAAAELYKALLAGRDNDMSATMERLEEYWTYNSQFCKRILDFLTIMFTAQGKMLLGDSSGLAPYGDRGRPVIVNHQEFESYLGRYSGLIMYLKEMDESRYSKTCATYFSAASELHVKQVKALFAAYANLLKRGPDEQGDAFGSTPTSAGWAAGGLRRAGTIARSPLDRKDKKEQKGGGELRADEALSYLLEQVAPQVYREEEFMADFLQINSASLTFADYMNLEHYFRQQAVRSAGLSAATTKLVRGAMDLIFGFLPAELKSWVDAAYAKDAHLIVGLIASVEHALMEAEERGNFFFARLLDKQHQRMKTQFDRHVDEQIKAVEQTKLSAKKRNGVAHFIKYFPSYVSRIESLLGGADSLEIRSTVDAAYERIVQSMLESLKHMAKLDGDPSEDKGQLNYHVILIENMHYFMTELGQMNISSVAIFKKRAETIYDENLSAYVKLVLRRPFAKIIDFFEGVERLLKRTAPTEVSKTSTHNRSALKKVVKEFNSKDVRKNVEALFKRVEKHFTEVSEGATTEASGSIIPGTVMVGVWQACEEELLRITELFVKRISQCYAESGVSLEYTVFDVEAAFKRHRVGN